MQSSAQNAVQAAATNQKQVLDTLEKLFSLAQPGSIYSHPLQAEGQTVITASEVVIGMGFGYGVGEGSGPAKADEAAAIHRADETAAQAGGGGGGGAGGGWTMGRPVAVISISPAGVTVEPVVDATKLGIAALTAFGAMALMFGRMRRRSR